MSVVELKESKFEGTCAADLSDITTNMEEAAGTDDSLPMTAERKEKPYIRFKRIAKLVRLLCSVCIRLGKYAKEAGFLQNYLITLTNRRVVDTGKGEKLSFDPSDFKSGYVYTVPGKEQRLFDIKPEDRTARDISAIHRIMMGVETFRKYTPEMQGLLCKIVRYERCDRRRVIVRKGHIGYNLYFIYSGAVSIFLDKVITNDPDEYKKKQVAVLRRGACFGEVALTQNTRRTATAVCAEEAELLVVDKDDFIDNRLHLRLKKEWDIRYKFFRSWNALESMPDSDIEELCHTTRLGDYNYNKVIVRDSRQNQWLWFVVKGSGDVVRLVDLEKCPQYQKLIRLEDMSALYVDSQRRPSTGLKSQNGSKPSSSPEQSKSTLSVPKIQTFEKVEKDVTVSEFGVTNSINVEDDAEKIVAAARRQQSKMLAAELQDGLQNKSAPEQKRKEEIAPCNDVGIGIFVKIDTLRDGRCFGLDSLFGTPLALSFVSKGCEVIQVPKGRFLELVDEPTLQKIYRSLKPCPSDTTLCQRFLAESKWTNFKRELTEAMLASSQSSKRFENNLRNFKRMEYLRRNEDNHWVPRTKMTANPLPYPREPNLNGKLPARRGVSAKLSGRMPIKNHDGQREKPSRPKTCPVPRGGHIPGMSRRPFSCFSSGTRSRTSGSADRGGRKVHSTIESEPVYARGSQRTLQLVTNVEFSDHLHRMRMIRLQ